MNIWGQRQKSTLFRLSLLLCGFFCGLVLTLGIPSQVAAVDPQPVLVVGTEADYIPFEYRPEDGDPTDPADDIVGFDIDLAKAIAHELGIQLQIVDMPFEQLFSALTNGDIDFAIAAITPTESRQTYLDFSTPYFEARHSLVSPRLAPIRTVSDLIGHRMVVQQGSIQESEVLRHLADGMGIEVEVFALEYMNDIVAAVRNGDADVALIEELVATAYLENNPTLVMDVLGEIDPTPMAIAFPKNSTYLEPFNQALEALKDSGEVQHMAQQWFTVNP